MKIIKQGDPSLALKEKTFKCVECGCEFIANKTEYKYCGSQYNIACYMAICPTCSHKVYTEEG